MFPMQQIFLQMQCRGPRGTTPNSKPKTQGSNSTSCSHHSGSNVCIQIYLTKQRAPCDATAHKSTPRERGWGGENPKPEKDKIVGGWGEASCAMPAPTVSPRRYGFPMQTLNPKP